MKICIVTPILFPEPGGPSTFVDNLVKSLRNEKHQVTIIAVSEFDDILESGDGYSVIKIRRKGSLIFRILKTVRFIMKYGRRNDIVFSCGLFLESAIAKLVTRKPLIIRIGGDPVWEKWTSKQGLKSDLDEFQRKKYCSKIELLKFFQRLSCRSADRVIANSYFLKDIIRNWGIKEEKIQIVYNGINETEINFQDKEALKRKFFLAGKKMILTVGRLIELKRIDEIIQSFSAFKDDSLELVIIGDGPKRMALAALAGELNLSKRVSFLGIRTHEEVLEYLGAADLFVLNSANEIMPNVVLESLAMGTPVIAPSVGGILEVIQNNVDGLLFKKRENNREDLIKAMDKLLSNGELRKQLVQNGFLKVNKFSWKNSYDKIISMLSFFEK